MPTWRTIRVLHAGLVSAAVAIWIYVVVPPFEPVFAIFGATLPTAARILMAAYPFAFLFPIAAVGLSLLPAESSRWRHIVVPSIYVFAVAIICLVEWAAYAPMNMLINESEVQHAP
jgi:hypothetical protein